MTSKNVSFDALDISQRTAFDIVKASGENILTYLQGQITQDLKKLSPSQTLYSAILQAQGKAITDFYLMQTQKKGDWAEVMLICPKDFSLALVERLRIFSLGFELRIGKMSSWQVTSVQGEGVDDFLATKGLPVPAQHRLAAADNGEVFALRMPESQAGGVWLMGADIGLKSNVDEEVMEQGRILQGIPYFGVDWSAKLHPLNANLVERDGVSFDKGCYVGQEVTSRMQWRGGIKKKLYRVQLQNNVALPCPILTTAKVGEITSLAQDEDGSYKGIALLPIEVVESGKTLATDASDVVQVLGVCTA
jgi:folate-binding protein YgfZ